jgi:hypothetical protein
MPELLAQGDDVVELTCFFTGKDKKRKSQKLKFSWDEVFKAIGPSMFGYLQGKNEYSGEYGFAQNLGEAIRTRIVDDVENRKIDLPTSEVETIILQFKQLGYIILATNDKEFRGWTLTPKGEAQLTRLKTVRRKKQTRP